MANRVERLAERIGETGADAFIAWDPVTMGYLLGFHENAHERFLALAISAKGEVRLICPALTESQARRIGIQDIRPWKDGEDPMGHFFELARDWNLKSAIIAVDAVLPARQLLKMQDWLPAALFKDGESIVASLMSRKEPEEIDRLRKAGAVADETFLEVFPKIRAGQTERQIEKMLNDGMTARGGTPAFAIVAAGANAAEPHHLSDDTVLKTGDTLILDFGCERQGYISDITRTVSVGPASDSAKEMYDLVYRAHMAARKAIRPGVPANSIDKAARDVIVAGGAGEAFFHRTGHGIGMQGHEHPYINDSNSEPLEPGNCFSIEPGVYFAGELGIRIENIVAVTEDGHESMNAEPSPTLLETGG
ncbi:M24 family metallopeptidase [Fimbriimonas ginsengisoli]|nr:Xaa-Pro peptidase family protein [Fimbriimonas ginsengisoli]